MPYYMSGPITSFSHLECKNKSLNCYWLRPIGRRMDHQPIIGKPLTNPSAGYINTNVSNISTKIKWATTNKNYRLKLIPQTNQRITPNNPNK